MKAKLVWPLLLIATSWACNCGTGPGDSTVCDQAPTCDVGQSAVRLFSQQGCQSAIDNSFCGVHAQRLAECLRDAALCLVDTSSRAAIETTLAASVCATQFAEWDGCFANGDSSGSGGNDDD